MKGPAVDFREPEKTYYNESKNYHGNKQGEIKKFITNCSHYNPGQHNNKLPGGNGTDNFGFHINKLRNGKLLHKCYANLLINANPRIANAANYPLPNPPLLKREINISD